MARFNANIGHPISLGYRLSLGSEALILGEVYKNWKIFLSASYLRHFSFSSFEPSETWNLKPMFSYAALQYDIRFGWEHTRTLEKADSRALASFGLYY